MAALLLVAFMIKAIGASPIETPSGGPTTEVDTGAGTGAGPTAAAPMFAIEDDFMDVDVSGPSTIVPDKTLSRKEIREIMGGDNPWNPSGEWDPPPPGMKWGTLKSGDFRIDSPQIRDIRIPEGMTFPPTTTTSTPWVFTGSTPEGVIPLETLIDGLGPLVDRKEALKRLAPYYGNVQRTTPRILCSKNLRSARLC